MYLCNVGNEALHPANLLHWQHGNIFVSFISILKFTLRDDQSAGMAGHRFLAIVVHTQCL